MTPSRTDPAPSLGGRYTLSDELGRGGMGVVYLARDERHGRRVAVKVLSGDVSSAIGVERFLSEIHTTAALSHPHIVPLLDSGEAEGQLYYVMPVVEGESLRERMRRRSRMPVEEVLRIGAEVAEALAYAHRHGVVHRDVKPENILLGERHAALADFGIARSVAAAVGLTRTGMAVGTPAYMSPEQAHGGEVDARSDVYSLACVLYEMLSGRVPAPWTEPPSLRTLRADVPSELEEVLQRALAIRPEARFATADALEAALSSVPAGRGAAAPAAPSAPAGIGGQARAPSWLRRALLAAGGVAATAVVLTGIGAASTALLDLKLQVPPTYRPSRPDHLVVGIQALVPFLAWALVGLTAHVVLTRMLGTAGAWVTRLTTRRGSGAAPRRGGWRTRLGRAGGLIRPQSAADGVFICSVGVFAGMLWLFRDLLGAPFSGGSEMLSCSARPVHRAYAFSFPVVIVGLAVARHQVFHWLDRRGGSRRSYPVARWGSGAWIVALLVVMAVPWRMLWNSDFERARVGGERAYVLSETEAEVLVYLPATGASRRYARPDMPELVLLGTTGYVFEEEEIFESGMPSC